MATRPFSAGTSQSATGLERRCERSSALLVYRYHAKRGRPAVLRRARSNIINFGGNKVALEDINAALEKTGLFDEVASVARRNKFGVEELFVFYASNRRVSTAQVNDALDSSVRLVRASSVTRLESLPRTATDKIDVQVLATM